MSVTREARHLSGNDLGKNVRATCINTGQTHEGELDMLVHTGVDAVLTLMGVPVNVRVKYDDPVTITGKEQA